MNSGLHKSNGILKYSKSDVGFKLIVEVDPGIALFYRALIPKYITFNPQRYAPHISVVRNEIPPNIQYWGKYENQEVEFTYSNVIKNGKVYWWLDAFSNQLEDIRVELGLPISSEYTRPPDGFEKIFHITIGNQKDLKHNNLSSPLFKI